MMAMAMMGTVLCRRVAPLHVWARSWLATFIKIVCICIQAEPV